MKKIDRDTQYRPCIRCGREGETRRCHYNGFRSHGLGKGRGIKASDLAVAEFCQHCDDRFSEANYPLWQDGSKSMERSELLAGNGALIMTLSANASTNATRFR